jgi:hypothetical protein
LTQVPGSPGRLDARQSGKRSIMRARRSYIGVNGREMTVGPRFKKGRKTGERFQQSPLHRGSTAGFTSTATAVRPSGEHE